MARALNTIAEAPRERAMDCCDNRFALMDCDACCRCSLPPASPRVAGSSFRNADAAIGGPWGSLAGAAGAVAGTLGGHAARARLAGAFESDPPAAFLEDAVAIGGAFLIVWALP